MGLPVQAFEAGKEVEAAPPKPAGDPSDCRKHFEVFGQWQLRMDADHAQVETKKAKDEDAQALFEHFQFLSKKASWKNTLIECQRSDATHRHFHHMSRFFLWRISPDQCYQPQRHRWNPRSLMVGMPWRLPWTELWRSFMSLCTYFHLFQTIFSRHVLYISNWQILKNHCGASFQFYSSEICTQIAEISLV